MNAMLKSLRCGLAMTFAVALLGACGGGDDSGSGSVVEAQALRVKSSAPLYRITDLGSLGGLCATATGINDKGEVTGIACLPGDYPSHVFVYRHGAMRDLGPMSDQPGGDWSAGLNERAQVTGSAYQTDGSIHAFLYSHGAPRDLGTLGGRDSAGVSINDRGEVAGWAWLRGNTEAHAFLYADDRMQDLGTLGGTFSDAAGVNDKGQVAGTSYLTGDATHHAFLFSHGRMHDLGALAGTSTNGTSYGLAINRKGEVTGTSSTDSGGSHAFLYADGKMRDLGAFDGDWSAGRNVNDKGEVVGYALIIDPLSPKSRLPRAFVYTDGKLRDLNDLLDDNSAAWTLTDAFGINNSGQIVGVGSNANGFIRAFLLTPTGGQPR